MAIIITSISILVAIIISTEILGRKFISKEKKAALVLNELYEKGEIDKQEFKKMKKSLE